MPTTEEVTNAIVETAKMAERLHIVNYLYQLADRVAEEFSANPGVSIAVATLYRDVAGRLFNQEDRDTPLSVDVPVPAKTDTVLLGVPIPQIPYMPNGLPPMVVPRPEPGSTVVPTSGPGSNTGHGKVWKRPDGIQTRCMGPGYCPVCSEDKLKFGTLSGS